MTPNNEAKAAGREKTNGIGAIEDEGDRDMKSNEAKYKRALQEIWQAAGRPVMSYEPSIELEERRVICKKMALIAQKVLEGR